MDIVADVLLGIGLVCLAGFCVIKIIVPAISKKGSSPEKIRRRHSEQVQTPPSPAISENDRHLLNLIQDLADIIRSTDH